MATTHTCNFINCRCTDYVESTSNWMKNKCRKCNHSQKEHGMVVEDESDEKVGAVTFVYRKLNENAGGVQKDKYAVNYDHVKMGVTELTHSINPSDDHSALKLLDIYDEIEISKEDLCLWQRLGSSKQSARNQMNSVLQYAENNKTCTPQTKQRLRCVVKLILDHGKQHYANYKHILLLIASHGNVCNVMKEVAINNAYGMCTGRDAMAKVVESQSLKEQIIRSLRDYRVLVVEEVFHFFKFTNNTHYIAGFHNTIADKIGVTPYNDPDICYPSHSNHPNWRQNLDKRYFAEFYTLDKILRHVLIQIDEKKIGYQKVVAWFEQNCPPGLEKTQFLQMVIDIDTGKISEEYMCWLLHKMDIFLVKDDDWKEIEKCWS